MIYELALFAGAGISSLAGKYLIGDWRTVCYVERDTYCIKIIKARIRDGYLDDVPIWSDVRTFRADNPECSEFIARLAALDNLVITAGFPRQPFSVAGHQKGADDPRNGWPDTIRIIRESQPKWVFLENVPGLLSGSRYFGRVLSDLAESGYDAKWKIVSAAEMGAPHKRSRVWVVAYPAGLGCQRDREAGKQELPVRFAAEATKGGCTSWNGWWEAEPGVGRVAHGVADGMDRLKALGNGWVPAVAEVAWEILR